jgi:hypothetical protein
LKSERALQQRPAPRPSASALLSVAPRLELSAMVMQIIHLSFLAATSRPRPSVIENPFLGSVCPQTTKSRATPEAEVPAAWLLGLKLETFLCILAYFLSLVRSHPPPAAHENRGPRHPAGVARFMLQCLRTRPADPPGGLLRLKNADGTLPLVSETKPRKRECDGT